MPIAITVEIASTSSSMVVIMVAGMGTDLDVVHMAVMEVAADSWAISNGIVVCTAVADAAHYTSKMGCREHVLWDNGDRPRISVISKHYIAIAQSCDPRQIKNDTTPGHCARNELILMPILVVPDQIGKYYG